MRTSWGAAGALDNIGGGRLKELPWRYVALVLGASAFGCFAAYSPVMASILFALFSLGVVVYLWPIVGVYMLVFTAPLLNVGLLYNNPIRKASEFVPVSFFVFLFTAAIYYLRRVVLPETRDTWRFKSLDTFLMAAIIAFSVASLFWSLDPTHGVAMLFTTAICFWMAKNLPRIITKPEQVRNVMVAIFITSFSLIVQLLLTKEHYDWRFAEKISKGLSFVTFLHVVVSSPGKLRLGGFAPVNMAANVLTFVMFVNVYLFYRSGWIARAVLAVHSLVVLYCIFKTASKAGIISLMMGLALLPLIVPWLREKVIRMGISGIVFFGLLFLSMGDVLIKRFERLQKGDLLSDRLEWWGKGFRELSEGYWVGLGAGGYPKVIDPVPAAHSVYLSLLFEYSFLGVALFAALLGVILWKVLKALPSIASEEMKMAAYCLLAELFVTLVHGLIDLDYNFLMLWLQLGLLLSICRVSGAEKAPKQAGG